MDPKSYGQLLSFGFSMGRDGVGVGLAWSPDQRRVQCGKRGHSHDQSEPRRRMAAVAEVEGAMRRLLLGRP